MSIPNSTVGGQDYNQAFFYIAALTQADPQSAIIDVRFMNDCRKDLPAISRRDTLPNLWNEIVTWNDQGFGVFVNINELDGNGRELRNVKTIRCQAVDLDTISAQQNYERAAEWNPAPSFAVESSKGKYHCYWITQQHNDGKRFTLLQRKLKQQFDGDKSVIDTTRVLRLPGTLHSKDPSNPHLVTFWTLGNYRKPIDPVLLELALHNVSVTDGAGGRHELGEPTLAAPNWEMCLQALREADPNELDRSEWVSFTAAWKQSAWTHASEDQLITTWVDWCMRFVVEDGSKPTPAYLQKAWQSIRNTEVGWGSLERRNPNLKATRIFGPVSTHPMPTPQAPQAPAPLDGYQNVISTSTDDSGKSTLIETVKLLHNQLNVAFDEFSQAIFATGPLPWDLYGKFPRRWAELDTLGTVIVANALFKTPGKDTAFDAVSMIANRNKFHIVRDYLCRIQWDGKPRLAGMLTTYFGVPHTEYSIRASAKFMIAAVARIMRPGCKSDHVLVLEGRQGLQKSSSLNALVGDDWFTDELPDLHSKDAAIQLDGKWIIEVAELSAFNKSDTETVKKFMSRSIDRYRAPYERIANDHPRQCLFVGTTNNKNYLKDQTDNRRFWPVTCGTIDIAGLQRDRDQLWAEALARFNLGDIWWFDASEEHLARAEQELRREIDPWEERINAHLETLGDLPTTVGAICFMLGISFEKQNIGVNKRIVDCLKHGGYERKQIRYGDKRVWQYVKTA